MKMDVKALEQKITGFIFLFLVSLLVSSCVNDAPPEQHLDGIWHWERTYGGFAGITIYADSVEHSQELRIDLSQKEATIYRDGTVTQHYDLRFKDHEWFEEKVWHMYPEKEKNPAIISFIEARSKNSIAVIQYCFDCFTSYYKR